jgi:transcriptional regulator of acetoin/glycerol metabolism
MKCLLEYDWPGNVRELENSIERAIALGGHNPLDISDLPPAIAVHGADLVGPNGAFVSAYTSSDLEDIERVTIQRVFQEVNGDKVLAGKMLGISRATLYRKLKRYNIPGQSRMEGARAATLH